MKAAATLLSNERNGVTPTKKRQKVEKKRQEHRQKRRYLRAKRALMETMKKQRIYSISENTETLKNAKK